MACGRSFRSGASPRGPAGVERGRRIRPRLRPGRRADRPGAGGAARAGLRRRVRAQSACAGRLFGQPIPRVDDQADPPI